MLGIPMAMYAASAVALDQPLRVEIALDQPLRVEIASVEEEIAVVEEEIGLSVIDLTPIDMDPELTWTVSLSYKPRERPHQVNPERLLNSTDRDPWTRSNAALPLHYMIASFVQSVSSGALYGMLMGSMAVPGHVYSTAKIFILAPWTAKAFVGFASDCFPIAGYHRKHYGAIGWCITAVAHLALAVCFRDSVVPKYCRDDKFGHMGNFVPEAGICNPHADSEAWKFVLLTSVSVIGIVIAESAADGLLLECAQSWRTPEKRGAVLMQALVVRISGSAIGSLFLAFCFNGREHLGFFEWEMHIWTINHIVVILAAFMVCMWQLFCSTDSKDTMRPSVIAGCCTKRGYRAADMADNTVDDYAGSYVDDCAGSYVDDYAAEYDIADSGSLDCEQPTKSGLYHITVSACGFAGAQLRLLCRELCTSQFVCFVAFQLLVPTMTWVTSPATEMMKRYWTGVQQMQLQLTDICIMVIFAVSICCLQDMLLASRWQRLFVLMTCVGATGSCIVGSLAALGICRDQYFYLTHELFLQLPRACNYLLATLVTAEIAPLGLEASVYGIITSAHSLAPLLARVCGNALFGQFPVVMDMPAGTLSVADAYLADGKLFRNLVALSVLASSTLVAASCLAYKLLPVDAEAARMLQTLQARQSDSSRARNVYRCVFCSACVVTLFVWTTAVTAYAVAVPDSVCSQC